MGGVSRSSYERLENQSHLDACNIVVYHPVVWMPALDLNKAVRMAIDTGKVLVGSERSRKAALHGEGKLILIASNCPRGVREDIVHYAKLSEIPAVQYEGTSMELGVVCGKPFPISVLAVVEEGSSNILDLARTAASKPRKRKEEIAVERKTTGE